MEIIIGKTAGFCYGVRNAVSKAEEKVRQYKQISCLGELVHNGEVIKKLEKLGMNIVENIENANKKVIIRAHGIAKEIYDKAKKLNIELFDFTCPSVLKIHKIAEEYAEQGYFIFLIGGKTHPECLGTISFCGENSCILENQEEIDDAIKKLKDSNLNKLFIIVQTTFNLENFNAIISKINNKISDQFEIKVKNTICDATKIRQDETFEISQKNECMIIIGGKNSSNTKKLYEIAKANCDNTYLIETKDELDLNTIKRFNSVGIMAGASTPDESINDVVMAIQA